MKKFLVSRVALSAVLAVGFGNAAGQEGGGGAAQDLPATGQTICYDRIEPPPAMGDTWEEAPCNTVQDCLSTRQDGHYKKGCVKNLAVDNVNGTVTDNCTGLTWQLDTADINAPAGVDAADQVSWTTALDHCANLTFGAGNETDWRLPSARELESIADYSSGTYIYAEFNAQGGPYWSSTSHADPDGAWVVRFVSEHSIGGINKSGMGWVRAVRGASGAGAGGGVADGDEARRGGGAGPQPCTDGDDNGNVNGDTARDLSDAVSLLAWLFQGGDIPLPFCSPVGPKEDDCAVENGNVNGDLAIDLSDAVSLLAWLFQGGDIPVPRCAGAEICDNNVDDDGDNFTDCDDFDCIGDSSCPEICDNNVDDDGDTFTDCNDFDCIGSPSCLETNCSNGVDDDGDTFTDCDDFDCCIDSDCTNEAHCPSGGTGLPDTAQTICYDDIGDPTDCNSATYPLQDADQETGCLPGGRFVLNDGGTPAVTSDDTITDNCTGLEWQRDPGNMGLPLAWCVALDYCENTLDGLAGQNDWRLPNAIELESITHYGRKGPALDPIFGQLPAAIGGNRFYWSSTTWGQCTCVLDRAFRVDFQVGGIASGLKSNDANHHVRGVRGP